MMRISPLGIFGANYALDQVAEWARQDAEITHIHRVCQEANALFAMAIAHAVRTGCDASDLYREIEGWAEEMDVDNQVERSDCQSCRLSTRRIHRISRDGYLIAFRNALWQLLNAETVEEGIVDTIMQGGDTDTNAAICGALLGAVYGREAIPERWIETIQNCRPRRQGRRGV